MNTYKKYRFIPLQRCDIYNKAKNLTFKITAYYKGQLPDEEYEYIALQCFHFTSIIAKAFCMNDLKNYVTQIKLAQNRFEILKSLIPLPIKNQEINQLIKEIDIIFYLNQQKHKGGF